MVDRQSATLQFLCGSGHAALKLVVIVGIENIVLTIVLIL